MEEHVDVKLQISNLKNSVFQKHKIIYEYQLLNFLPLSINVQTLHIHV